MSYARKFFSILFLAMITLPLLCALWELRIHGSQKENAQREGGADGENGIVARTRYLKELGTHFGKTFPGRILLVRAHALIKWSIGDSVSDQVLRGQNDWLFFANENIGDSVGDWLGLNRYGPRNLDAFIEYYATLHAILQANGIDFAVVVAPNKQSIYPDKLPKVFRQAGTHSNFSDVIEAMRARGIPVITLKKQLWSARKEFPVYGPFGTHWNAYGASVAQEEIQNTLHKIYGYKEPRRYTPDMFELDESGTDRDLARLMALDWYLEVESPVLKNGWSECVTHENIQSVAIKTERPIRQFRCPTGRGRIVAFRDSFFTELIPYFAQYYKESYFIWTRPKYQTYQRMIEVLKPTIVLEEWVERAFPIRRYVDSSMQAAIAELCKAGSEQFVLGSRNIDQVKTNSDVTLELTAKSDTIDVVVNGSAPIIRLPEIKVENPETICIDGIVISDQPGKLVVYYGSTDNDSYPFSANKKAERDIMRGNNRITLIYSSSDFDGNLRIDPVVDSRNIQLKGLRISRLPRSD